MPAAGTGLEGARSVLFLRLGKLGDMIVSAWLFGEARRALPKARLGLVTLPRSLEFSRGLPEFDEVRAWSPLALPGLTWSLRGRWDWIVDLNELPSRRSRLAMGLFRPGKVAAFRATGLKADIVFDPPTKEESHVLDRLACAGRALGFGPCRSPRPRVVLPEGALEAARRRIGEGPSVTLNLSAGHPSRYWPLERWRGLAHALLEADPRLRLQVLASAQDSSLVSELLSTLPAGRICPAPGPGLWDFLAAVGASKLLISPDTSAIHCASAFGVRVVGLYPEPAWNLASWGPWGRGHRVLRSPSGGLEALPLESVRTAALLALKGAPARRPLRSRARP